MKKLLYLSLILFQSLIQIKSQDFNLSFQTGFGSYSMSDLMGFNQSVLSGLPFDAKIVSDFPGYLYYRPMISMKLNRLERGLVYSYQSTGSRISAKDYSAEYRFDMNVNSHCPGFFLGYDLFEQRKINLSLNSIIGVSFSNLKINEYLSVFDSTVSDYNMKLKSMNFFIEPGFIIAIPISFIKIGLNFSYCIQFGDQAFHLDKNKDNTLQDPVKNTSVKPQWNGIRAGISAFYTIPK